MHIDPQSPPRFFFSFSLNLPIGAPLSLQINFHIYLFLFILSNLFFTSLLNIILAFIFRIPLSLSYMIILLYGIATLIPSTITSSPGALQAFHY